MKLDFYTALVVIAASSASAITIVKNDANLDEGLPKGALAA